MVNCNGPTHAEKIKIIIIIPQVDDLSDALTEKPSHTYNLLLPTTLYADRRTNEKVLMD